MGCHVTSVGAQHDSLCQAIVSRAIEAEELMECRQHSHVILNGGLVESVSQYLYNWSCPHGAQAIDNPSGKVAKYEQHVADCSMLQHAIHIWMGFMWSMIVLNEERKCGGRFRHIAFVIGDICKPSYIFERPMVSHSESVRLQPPNDRRE